MLFSSNLDKHRILSKGAYFKFKKKHGRLYQTTENFALLLLETVKKLSEKEDEDHIFG